MKQAIELIETISRKHRLIIECPSDGYVTDAVEEAEKQGNIEDAVKAINGLTDVQVTHVDYICDEMREPLHCCDDYREDDV